MKIAKNNRQEKISNVSEVIKGFNFDLESVDDQDKLVEEITYKIFIEKMIKRPESVLRYQESNNFYKLIIDCYERALASVSLYFFKNGIKSTIGYVYLVSNPAHPNHIKVGYSQDAESRLLAYQVSTPYKDFKLEKYIIVRNAYKLEQSVLHECDTLVENGEWIKCVDVKQIFEKICQIASELKFYNRFGRKKESFFADISGSDGSPLKKDSIKNVIRSFYERNANNNRSNIDHHIRDETGKILIRRNRVSDRVG